MLVACGRQFSPPAAVVGGRDITMDRLQRELDILLAQPQFSDPTEGPQGDGQRKDLTRRLLAFLIQYEVIAEYARAHGVSVTEEEVDEQVAAEVDRLGGQVAFDQELETRGVTLEVLRRDLERGVLFDKVTTSVLEELGISPMSEGAQRALQKWFGDRLAALDVDVNPRFGRFDPETGQIQAATSTAG